MSKSKILAYQRGWATREKGTKIRHMSREARLALACEGSKRYKGVRYPRCNDEHPCKSCLKIYVDKHPAVVSNLRSQESRRTYGSTVRK